MTLDHLVRMIDSLSIGGTEALAIKDALQILYHAGVDFNLVVGGRSMTGSYKTNAFLNIQKEPGKEQQARERALFITLTAYENLLQSLSGLGLTPMQLSQIRARIRSGQDFKKHLEKFGNSGGLQ